MLWAGKYKGKKWKLPSMNEVLEGLMLWYARQMEVILSETKDKNLRMRSIKNNRAIFKEIFHLMDFTQDQMNKPLTGSMSGRNDPILGLWNPYSKACCLLMQLYSMEIGSPQLYAEVNRVARD